MRMLGAVAVIWLAHATPLTSAKAAIDCEDEARSLGREETELPRLEVASRADRPPYCITLETLMAFAGRVKTHVGHCPGSSFAPALPQWARNQGDYARLFAQNRCKRTIGQPERPKGAARAR